MLVWLLNCSVFPLAAVVPLVWFWAKVPVPVATPPAQASEFVPPRMYFDFDVDRKREALCRVHIFSPGAKSCVPCHCFTIMLSFLEQSSTSCAVGTSDSPNAPTLSMASRTISSRTTVKENVLESDTQAAFS